MIVIMVLQTTVYISHNTRTLLSPLVQYIDSQVGAEIHTLLPGVPSSRTFQALPNLVHDKCNQLKESLSLSCVVFLPKELA